MRWSLLFPLSVAALLVPGLGCGVYVGREKVGETHSTKAAAPVERGQPRQLKVEALKANGSRSGVAVNVTFACQDTVRVVQVTHEQWVCWRARYGLTDDLGMEPAGWLAGLLIGPLLQLNSDEPFDWRGFCMWPPIDLLVRLFGGHGWSHDGSGTRGCPYTGFPPSYPRRLTHWFAWTLPGYTLGDAYKRSGTRETAEREHATEQAKLREAVAPGATVTLQTSADPGRVLEATTNSQGIAGFDLSRQLKRTCRGRRLIVSAKAQYQGLTATGQKTFDPADLGVTWDKPLFTPETPPDLAVDTQFRDRNRNEMLDANETATFTIKLRNRGRGEAFQIKVVPEIQGNPQLLNLHPDKEVSIEGIQPGEEKSVDFTFRAENEVPAQLVRVRFRFEEINGFEPKPVLLSFRTRPYDPPHLVVTGWSLDDDMQGATYGNGDGKLDPNEKAEITVILRNEGKGGARKVSARLVSRELNVTAGTIEGDLGDVPAGKWRKAVFSVIANRRYKGKDKLPLTLEISEERKKFAFTAALEIGVGKAEGPGEQLVRLTGREKEGDVQLAPLPELKGKKRKPMTALDLAKGEHYALLIGIENYEDDNIGDLSYSVDDVSALRELLAARGRFKADNIFLMTDAAGNPNDLPTRLNILLTLKWLAENLKPEDTLLFGFSGHGETDGGVNFLIPVNGRLALPRDTSIPLKRVLVGR